MIMGTINGIQIAGDRPSFFMDEVENSDGSRQSSKHYWAPIVIWIGNQERKDQLTNLSGDCLLEFNSASPDHREQWKFTEWALKPLYGPFMLLTYASCSLSQSEVTTTTIATTTATATS